MSFVEQPLFGREIVVPAKLPMILKQFCKAAIRTQPYDLLKWSGSYFRALAEGEELPVKSRLEYPPPSTASGLTLGFLRVLLRQFGSRVLHRQRTRCVNCDASMVLSSRLQQDLADRDDPASLGLPLLGS